MPPMRVLISGAGVAGPCLAWFLSNIGAHVTIVEKASAILPHGQNIDINGSALILLRKMGLLDEVRRLTTGEKGTRFMDPQGRAFALLPVGDGNGNSPTAEYEILRGDLSAIFYKATKSLPNVDYVFGTTIEKIVSNDEHSVKVQTSNGETSEYDLLVAADGQWSSVRKMCFQPEEITVIDKNMYAVYFTIPRLPEDIDWWSIYSAVGARTISTRPDPHGTMRAMLTHFPRKELEKKAWAAAARSDRATQQKLMRSVFADAGWQIQRLLDSETDASDFYFQPVQQIKLSKWAHSRVVCLGDAGYAPSPLTGMGASLAILGSYVLAGELSKLQESEHPSKAFEAYETSFRPFVEDTQNVPSYVPGIAHPETARGVWLFQTVISLLSKLIAITWITKAISLAFSKRGDKEDFKLQTYQVFGNQASK